ncbi:hypothetical protein AAFF_G00305950 [Aldrovandia affinis]|uniref:Uncharacterized protein n=1 Tax=Aldrovandia affinis TaxID=143900 RepID=A0AAD7WS57_9TELE|nr:hypothetical protein AAFF_G00305950 [Aldrovandia affinis]
MVKFDGLTWVALRGTSSALNSPEARVPPRDAAPALGGPGAELEVNYAGPLVVRRGGVPGPVMGRRCAALGGVRQDSSLRASGADLKLPARPSGQGPAIEAPRWTGLLSNGPETTSGLTALSLRCFWNSFSIVFSD